MSMTIHTNRWRGGVGRFAKLACVLGFLAAIPIALGGCQSPDRGGAVRNLAYSDAKERCRSGFKRSDENMSECARRLSGAKKER